MLCVVSIVNSVSATSMPVNEFVIYRSVHNYNIRQILIVCDTRFPANVDIPENIDVYLVGKDKKRIRDVVKKIQNLNKENSIIYHMHHQKSALIFLWATIGMNVRSHTLYTIHSTYSKRNLKYKLSSCLCSIWANYANCVSNSAYKEYSSMVKKLKKEKFLSIRNGVDTERIDAILKNKKRIKNSKKMICVGRMIPLKNHEFLVSLMKELPEYTLTLIGLEDDNKKIRKLAKSYGIDDRVKFLGLVSRDEVFDKLSSASIYVSASYVEGLPVSVLEAMRVGLIPVISAIPSHQEIANYSKYVNTLPFEKDRWVEKIKYIERLEEEEFKIISDKIKNSVSEEFSLVKMHNRYMEVYKKLI